MDFVFTAGVQYDDWRGSAAADGADKADIHAYLEEKKLINPGELVVGIELWVGEPDYRTGEPHVGARAFVVKADKFETAQAAVAADPFDVRKIELKAEKLSDFFRLFKRFNVKIMKKGLDLDGREYCEVDYL